jgi:hypothetical protein
MQITQLRKNKNYGRSEQQRGFGREVLTAVNYKEYYLLGYDAV